MEQFLESLGSPKSPEKEFKSSADLHKALSAAQFITEEAFNTRKAGSIIDLSERLKPMLEQIVVNVDHVGTLCKKEVHRTADILRQVIEFENGLKVKEEQLRQKENQVAVRETEVAAREAQVAAREAEVAQREKTAIEVMKSAADVLKQI